MSKVSIDQLVNKETQSNICIDYKNGVSRRMLIDKYHVGDQIIIQVLQHNHLPIKTKPKYNRDFTFFNEIDTEIKAYWLGAIYADGNVASSEKYGIVRASLSSIDKDWLETFKSDLQYEGPILCEHHKKLDKYIWKLNFANREMAKSLIRIGCIPAKSLIKQFPVLPEELVRHFIRGYFDGNGCVYVGQPTWQYKESNLRLMKSAIVSGSKDFLERLVFELPCINKEIFGRKGHLHTFTINFNASDTCILYDYMYKDATRYLQRKKTKFDEYFKERGSTTIISDSNPKKE